MKNTDKAKELGGKHARQYHHNTYPEYSHNSEFVFSNNEIETACKEMAEWKDECFQAVIDRVRESYQLDSSVTFVCDLIEQRYKDKFR